MNSIDAPRERLGSEFHAAMFELNRDVSRIGLDFSSAEEAEDFEFYISPVGDESDPPADIAHADLALFGNHRNVFST